MMVATMAARIFINYRRADSTATAGRLHDRLAQTFGRKILFMDVDHVPAGVDFVEYLHSQVATCEVFLAVIGPNWLDAKDDDGCRRLDNPDDFVTIEIAAALARNIRVIPVLVDGARMPKVGDLPDSLKPLVRRQAIDLHHDRFGRDAEALIDRIREALRKPEVPRQAIDLHRDRFGRNAETLLEKIREALRDKLIRVKRWQGAGIVAALLLLGWIGVYATGMPISLPVAAQADTRAQAQKAKVASALIEVEAKAKAAAEDEARTKTDQLDKERLAAAKAEEDQKAKAAAEAEAKRKSEESERQRLTAGNPGQADGIGWLGVRTQKVTNEIAESLNIKPPRGALVANVDDRGPAKPAGIERGDVIVKFDGKDIKETSDLRPVISSTPVGKQTVVVVIRKGKEETKTVTVGRLPGGMVLVRQGNTALNDRDYDAAIAAFNEAIRLDPNYAPAFYDRGVAYGKKDDYDRAISDYNEAIRLSPTAAAFNSRGFAYSKKGDNDRAVADYNEAIRLDPKNAQAFLNRGILHAKQGDNNRAIADYDEVIRLDPNNANAFNNRGNAYRRKDDLDRALADYNEAIRLGPTNALYLCNRGRAKLRINDASGNADIDKARQLDASKCS
jgi:tetratricopeptide (TPR) repeat protein